MGATNRDDRATDGQSQESTSESEALEEVAASGTALHKG